MTRAGKACRQGDEAVVKLRQVHAAEGTLRPRRRRVAAPRAVRRRRSRVKTSGFELPLASASRSLQRLRGDIDVLVNTAARETTASRRAALVQVHHELRLLGQRVNAALGTSDIWGEQPQQHSLLRRSP